MNGLISGKKAFGFRKPATAAATGLLFSTAMFMGTLLGHNLTVSSSMAPASGSTITDTETTVSGTFSNSGCGLGATISVHASDGDIGTVTQSCTDGTWSWSASWSNYGPGLQTVWADFQSGYHGGGNQFVHTGSVSRTYDVVAESTCELPDAPAIANAYMRNVLGITNRDQYNTIIPQVAQAMNAGEFGENACAPGYADNVRDFVDSLLD